MILSFISIRKIPQEVLKTSGFTLGYQHFPRDLVDVNEWNTMFDSSIKTLVSFFNDDMFTKGSVQYVFVIAYERHHEKTGFLHMRKQRHRSASLHYIYSKISLLS